jgi:hypothetical protein
MYDTVDAAKKRSIRWDVVWVVGAVALVCAGLVWGGLQWPIPTAPDDTVFPGQPPDVPLGSQPFLALLKLVAAALIGILVTAVHAPSASDRPSGRAMQHAQILLTVAGAMMMIIIGNSLARAFGIAGAASIIRFRTPVEDPKDVTIIFLLMSLGMACGLGAFAIAGLGTAFLCTFLYALDRTSARRPRALTIEIAAEPGGFPDDHVQRVFARNRVVFETCEVSHGKETVVAYHALVDPHLSLDDLSAQLMAGSGVRSVSWESPKKGF